VVGTLYVSHDYLFSQRTPVSPSTAHLRLHLVLHVLCGGRGLFRVCGRGREILGGDCDCGWGRSDAREGRSGAYD
jgi:hypothetical protein